MMPPGPMPSDAIQRTMRRVLGVCASVTLPCPMCNATFERGVQRAHHYLGAHAVTDNTVTTFTAYRCAGCGMTFRCRAHRRSHTCATNAPRRRREGKGADFRLPLQIRPLAVEALRWVLFTDGSGTDGKPGCGVTAYLNKVIYHGDALFALSGPVLAQPRHHLFEAAVDATSNATELKAFIEAMVWLLDEAPRPRMPRP